MKVHGRAEASARVCEKGAANSTFRVEKFVTLFAKARICAAVGKCTLSFMYKRSLGVLSYYTFWCVCICQREGERTRGRSLRRSLEVSCF